MSSGIQSEKAAEPVGQYPHARRAGNLLFLSGIGPRVKGEKLIPGVTLSESGEVLDHDIETQCHSVFNNVRAVLEAAGAQWEDLLDVTVFLTDMKRDFPTYNRVWAEYFAQNPPCRTTVEVTRLPTPIAIELKCIALLPETREQEIKKVQAPRQIVPVVPDGVRLLGGESGLTSGNNDIGLLIAKEPLRAASVVTAKIAAWAETNRTILPSAQIRTLTLLDGTPPGPNASNVVPDILVRKSASALAVSAYDSSLTAMTCRGPAIDPRKVAAALPRIFRGHHSAETFAETLGRKRGNPLAAVEWAETAWLAFADGEGLFICLTDADLTPETMDATLLALVEKTGLNSTFFLSTGTGPKVQDPQVALQALAQLLG